MVLKINVGWAALDCKPH